MRKVLVVLRGELQISKSILNQWKMEVLKLLTKIVDCLSAEVFGWTFRRSLEWLGLRLSSESFFLRLRTEVTSILYFLFLLEVTSSISLLYFSLENSLIVPSFWYFFVELSATLVASFPVMLIFLLEEEGFWGGLAWRFLRLIVLTGTGLYLVGVWYRLYVFELE
jgi:hypothetical protein